VDGGEFQSEPYVDQLASDTRVSQKALRTLWSAKGFLQMNSSRTMTGRLSIIRIHALLETAVTWALDDHFRAHQ
jgi:hypothetical protein